MMMYCPGSTLNHISAFAPGDVSPGAGIIQGTFREQRPLLNGCHVIVRAHSLRELDEHTLMDFRSAILESDMTQPCGEPVRSFESGIRCYDPKRWRLPLRGLFLASEAKDAYRQNDSPAGRINIHRGFLPTVLGLTRRHKPGQSIGANKHA